MEKLLPSMMIAAFGMMLLWIGIYKWKERYFCKETIRGKCLSVTTYSQFGTCYTHAVFEYFYAGKRMHYGALEDLTRRQRKQFKEGEIYTLYVNPQKPSVYRCTKQIFKWEDFFLIILGGVIVGGAIVLLFQG